MNKDHKITVDLIDHSSTGIVEKFVLPFYRVGKKLVTRIHPRVWAITGILTFILALLLIIYAGAMLLVDKESVAQANTITIAEALRAPFNLDDHARLEPNIPIDDVLPDSFGDFQRVAESEIEMLPLGRLSSCLVDNGTFECEMNYRPQHQLTAYYTNTESDIIEVAVANYWNARVTSETMVDAVHSAGIFSRVGDFVVGATEIDYFYSTTRDWFSFTWGRGAWVFSISARTPDILTTAVQAFPY